MKFTDMDLVMAYLKEYGKVIGSKAQAGDVLCKEIVNWYKLHYKAQGDPGAKAILMIKLEEYDKREKEAQP